MCFNVKQWLNINRGNVNSSASSVILILLAFSEIFLRKIQNCLRIPVTAETTFLDVCSTLEIIKRKRVALATNMSLRLSLYVENVLELFHMVDSDCILALNTDWKWKIKNERNKLNPSYSWFWWRFGSFSRFQVGFFPSMNTYHPYTWIMISYMIS